jgi:hypothetical protein
MVRRFAALGLVALLALGACGGDDSGGSTSDTTRGSSTEASAAKSTDDAKSTTTDDADADAGGSGAIESAKNCRQLVEAATPVLTRVFQGLVDDVQGLSVAELAELDNPQDSDLFKQWTDEVEAETKAIDEKVDDLDCTEEDGNKAVCDAVAAIKADNPIAEAMVKGMAGEC